MKIHLSKDLTGPILDIGGGGEGVIGRLYGSQVVAIDNRQEELDEAPDGFEKRLMDARSLIFSDGYFAHITFFYSAMYFAPADLLLALQQAFRVLRPGGQLHLWDAHIESAWPEPFITHLDIEAPGLRLHTSYGVGRVQPQSAASISDFCKSANFVPLKSQQQNGHFYLIFEKQS